MKKVLLLSAAVLAMTACSNTDVIEEGALQQTNAIGFQSMVNKGSRALDTEGFNKFYVYGSYTPKNDETKTIVIFNGVEVTKGVDEWTYNESRYWVDGGVYRFYGYSNDNSPLTENEGSADFGSTTGILNINNYVANATHQKDLVFTKSESYTGKENGNPTVSMQFSHALARIMVTFKSGFPKDYDMAISNVRVKGLYTVGSYKSESMTVDHAWIADTNSKIETENDAIKPPFTDNSVAKAADGANDAVDVTSGFAYVIPCTYTDKQVSISFDMSVTHNGVLILGRKMQVNWAPKWESNKSYNYNLTVNGSAAGLEPIKFSASISDWETGTPTVGNMDLGVEYEATASE